METLHLSRITRVDAVLFVNNQMFLCTTWRWSAVLSTVYSLNNIAVEFSMEANCEESRIISIYCNGVTCKQGMHEWQGTGTCNC